MSSRIAEENAEAVLTIPLYSRCIFKVLYIVSPCSCICVCLLSSAGVYCAEARHGEDVRHEVHEQTAMHRARWGPKRL